MALEVLLEIDLVAPRILGNKPMINYGIQRGWLRYNKTISNKYRSKIRTEIKTHKYKN